MRPWLPQYGYQSYKRFQRTGRLQASPPTVLAIGFLVLILIGTGLLALPISTVHGIALFDALFMATSAVTVTGLTVIEPGVALSPFGQGVLIALVQLGGVGFVTFAVIAAITLGKKLSLRHQALALEAFNQTSVAKIHRTAISVFKISFIMEGIAATILTLWWWRDDPFLTALSRAVFHAIAAFNNAGFSLYPDSLAQYASDPVTILVITFSIILGGIGFTVLNDVGLKRRWTNLTPYTKVIILGTIILNALGFLAILLMEYNNPATLGGLGAEGQVLGAWLHSVTARTAGFTSVDITQFHDSTTLVMMLLMFIGGGSMSTASGIKLGTFIVLLAAVYSYLSHRKEVTVMTRSVAQETVQKALAIMLVTATLIFVGTLLLSLFERMPFVNLFFEVVSAVSTTGLSRQVTPELSRYSQTVLIFLMFAGRLGPLTLAYSLGTQRRSRIRYPEADFQVG